MMITHDARAIVTAGDHMIDRACVLESKRTGHAKKLRESAGITSSFERLYKAFRCVSVRVAWKRNQLQRLDVVLQDLTPRVPDP